MTVEVGSMHRRPWADTAPVRSVMAAGKAIWKAGGWSTVSVMTGFLLWEIVARLVGSSLFLAAPSQIVVAIGELWQSGELARHAKVSASEFVIGYSVACLAGIAVGMVMAASSAWRQALQPWVSGLYATPTIALAPLFILWLGIGIWSKVLVVVSLVIFPVIINTEVGLRTTSENLVETARAFGADARQIFLKVSLPSALPFIMAGLRLGIGRGLIGVVVAELFGARAGLGLMITQAAETFNMAHLFAGVVILAFAGVALSAAFSYLEKILMPWKD
jgi:NitT/TauT family transport system permease protein